MVKSSYTRYIVLLDESILEIGILYILYSDWSLLVISGFRVFLGTLFCFQVQMESKDSMTRV